MKMRIFKAFTEFIFRKIGGKGPVWPSGTEEKIQCIIKRKGEMTLGPRSEHSLGRLLGQVPLRPIEDL